MYTEHETIAGPRVCGGRVRVPGGIGIAIGSGGGVGGGGGDDSGGGGGHGGTRAAAGRDRGAHSFNRRPVLGHTREHGGGGVCTRAAFAAAVA